MVDDCELPCCSDLEADVIAFETEAALYLFSSLRSPEEQTKTIREVER